MNKRFFCFVVFKNLKCCQLFHYEDVQRLSHCRRFPLNIYWDFAQQCFVYFRVNIHIFALRSRRDTNVMLRRARSCRGAARAAARRAALGRVDQRRRADGQENQE